MRGSLGSAAVIAVAALAAGGCGGSDQSASEPSGTFKVDVVRTSFPKVQHLAETQRFEMEVRNAGNRAIENVALTLQGFSAPSDATGLSDPDRPVWVVDQGPRGGDTAYRDTWALGRLAAGQTKTFRWRVAALQPGEHRLRWRVAAGLTGKATAVTTSGDAPEGEVTVLVDSRPSDSKVDPATGRVVRKS